MRKTDTLTDMNAKQRNEFWESLQPQLRSTSHNTSVGCEQLFCRIAYGTANLSG